jgi:hypothetical protein
MRIYSYLFHALLGLFMLGISVIALLSGTSLHLEMLPWSGNAGTYALLGGALFGLLSLLLALQGTARILFFLWSLAVFAVMLKGFFLSPYRFADPAGFKTAALLTLGALLAILGAWFQLSRSTGKRAMSRER